MATKLMLVPEPMYKALITQQNKKCEDADDDGQINLNFIKENMLKARDNRGKNLSSKNINYQQELRRYLKVRKEMKEKPREAVLADGSKVIAKPIDDAGVHFSNRKRRGKTQDIHALLVGDDGEVKDDIAEKKGRASGIEKPTNVEMTYAAEKPTSSKSNAPVNLTYPREIASIPEAKMFYDYLLKNPKAYGITDDGQKIIKGKKAIESSSVGAILEHLFNGGGPGSVEPTGTAQLLNKISSNQRYKQLLTEYKRKLKFIPSKWN